ncbi:uncharacterized protein TEOVI_000219800 [Trypanosoma equiperdum]|uniref:Uncharacterized protein n=3 Tax=Trypanozoon TaxID=39700 RepID=C9ZKE6_TRYB9|nr:hypothetical protein, unlikely [Trypanosoma brucei gambiense DAL972]RHW73416.1 hypothetical protein DPX39_030023800 [Trypanosoma brucei equiperdum]CBH09910.1 hypothetical protein, unlikely [Trypanosoma brucei gambiense DAL972]SCU70624.1 hypothetical protein, conserved [Trypanosoma equiperdum]|eukprot:XP_011772203.1 hypothetical protein, unlikely [Trypanosoma brucei gambiense DAL972]
MPPKKSSNAKAGKSEAVSEVSKINMDYVQYELPSPDMAVVEKYIETAKAKARASSAQRRREGRKSCWRAASPNMSLCKKIRGVFCPNIFQTLKGPVRDFVLGFVVTFFVMYVFFVALYFEKAPSKR